jgi:isocitrate/isopropylmalate dehydrogenase
MTFELKMTKGQGGWKAQSEISLGECDGMFAGTRGERILKLSTYKHSRGGIWSLASVAVRENQGGYYSESTMLFQDYNKTVQHIAAARATEKAIKQAHETALQSFPAIIEEARAQYAAKVHAVA